MKVATNRTNFHYATLLKKRGFKTAVHALPEEARGLIHEMLAEDRSSYFIANEVMRRYGEAIKELNLKPISHTSITTYRKHHWVNTTHFKTTFLGQTPEMVEAIKEVKSEFDAYLEMVRMARKQKEKADMADSMEEKVKLPTKRGDETRLQSFLMFRDIVDKEIALGIRQKGDMELPPIAASSSTVNLNIETGLDQDKIIQEARDAIEALEKKGKYAINAAGGERLANKGSKGKS